MNSRRVPITDRDRVPPAWASRERSEKILGRSRDQAGRARGRARRLGILRRPPNGGPEVSRNQRIGLIAAAIVVAVAAFLIASPGGDDDEQTSTRPSAT